MFEDLFDNLVDKALIAQNSLLIGQDLSIAKQATTIGADANKFYVWDGSTAHTTSKVAAIFLISVACRIKISRFGLALI